MDTIADLDQIMKKGDYVRWLTYVSKESKDYWMNAKRLKELEGRLPVKGLKLSGLWDYFKYIFIPASGYCAGSMVGRVGLYGFIWTSSLNTSHTNSAWYMYFVSGFCDINYINRSYGGPVRGVMD